MSKTTDWILDQVDSGKLIYVEGRGYVKPEDYAHEYMKTDQYQKEFDKAFSQTLPQIDNIIDGLKGGGR